MEKCRKITYTPKDGIQKQYSSKKWGKLDDAIFDNLSDILKVEDKIKLADLLNLFYYFIICYSKTCFKKNANWNDRYGKNNTSNRIFDYKLANELDSHALLLTIQKKLYVYRKEYNNIKTECKFSISETNKIYFTPSRILELNTFIHESLYKIIHFVMPPVKLISKDILEKLNKYNNISSQNTKVSSKLNVEVLKNISSIAPALELTSSNMIQIHFHSS
jgi:hypothetical protein